MNIDPKRLKREKKRIASATSGKTSYFNKRGSALGYVNPDDKSRLAREAREAKREAKAG